MPETKHDARSKEGLPSVVRRNNSMHEREQACRFVEYFHIDIEHDMAVFRLGNRLAGDKGEGCKISYLHEQFDGLRKGRNGLLWFLLGPRMFHTVRPIPVLLSNEACVNDDNVRATRRSGSS